MGVRPKTSRPSFFIAVNRSGSSVTPCQVMPSTCIVPPSAMAPPLGVHFLRVGRPQSRGTTTGWASVRECHPKDRLGPPCDGAPGRPGRGASSIRSGRWRGSKAVTTHDLAKLFDVRRAPAGEHVGDILEIARAHQAWTDDGKEAGVNIAAVTESMDHAARYEERLARFQVGAPPADGKRSHAVQPKNGFVELVVAVRRGHARIRWILALEHADTSSGLVRVDVKTDGESPDLD